jgi:hypothetical protein
MSNNDQMTIDERRKYLRMMKKRYVKANSKKAKGLLLYEMEAVTGLDRKTLIRLMNSSLERKPRSRQRGAIYGPDVDDALRVIYESCDYICAERLTPSLVWMAQHLAAHGELAVTPSLLEHLGQISVSTVQRRLLRITQDQYQLPRRKPKPRHRLTQSIPMLRLPWNIASVGLSWDAATWSWKMPSDAFWPGFPSLSCRSTPITAASSQTTPRPGQHPFRSPLPDQGHLTRRPSITRKTAPTDQPPPAARRDLRYHRRHLLFAWRRS